LYPILNPILYHSFGAHTDQSRTPHSCEQGVSGSVGTMGNNHPLAAEVV
jgi:hypothetical protein